jgi:acyl-CoA reductase-like NAD-dependent aldehyde dehydrogenase
MPETVHNLIDGRWVPARSGKTFENRNPADPADLLGLFADSDEDDIFAAVASARRAYDEWRLVPAPRRAEIIHRTATLLQEREEELARIVTRETGKVLSESRSEVREAIDCGYFVAGEGRRLYGETTPSELANKLCLSVRLPVGVCGIITPWNFPLAIPAGKVFAALVGGNTVVLKPSEEAPAAAVSLVRCLVEAGAPHGTMNLVTGTGPRVGGPLAAHPDVKVVSFTGSTEVGKRLSRQCGEDLKRISLELGGKSGQIVMDDADLDVALGGVLWGAFGATGQRSAATSRLILHRPVAPAMIDRVTAAARALRMGNGLEDSTQIGPLISEAQRRRVAEYVAVGRREGAELLCGGEVPDQPELAGGFFYPPTIFGNVRPSMRIAQEEIFGPVLSVIIVDSFEEAIHVLNDTTYGLSSSIYTRDVGRAMRAVRDVEAGVTCVNGPTVGAEVHLPFGGIKDSGDGHREASHSALDAFTERKTVYIDYSGKLQRARVDNQ